MSKNYGTLQDKNGNSLIPNAMEVVTNTNGTALKFPDGTMICYGEKNISCEITKTLGSVYYGYVDNIAVYPVAFINDALVFFTHHTTGDVFAIQPYGYEKNINAGHNRKQYTGGVYPICGITGTQNFYVTWLAIGRWK